MRQCSRHTHPVTSAYNGCQPLFIVRIIRCSYSPRLPDIGATADGDNVVLEVSASFTSSLRVLNGGANVGLNNVSRIEF